MSRPGVGSLCTTSNFLIQPGQQCYGQMRMPWQTNIRRYSVCNTFACGGLQAAAAVAMRKDPPCQECSDVGASVCILYDGPLASACLQYLGADQSGPICFMICWDICKLSGSLKVS
jgi:hypothetical protein